MMGPVEQLHNRLTVPQMLGDDRLYSWQLDMAVPNIVRADEDHWAIATDT
jgi:hypothetical protein